MTSNRSLQQVEAEAGDFPYHCDKGFVNGSIAVDTAKRIWRYKVYSHCRVYTLISYISIDIYPSSGSPFPVPDSYSVIALINFKLFRIHTEFNIFPSSHRIQDFFDGDLGVGHGD